MTMTKLTIHAADGHRLVAHCFEPPADARASLVIAPGIGIAQAFYASFAGFMAQQGYRVWTFDYRGTGQSRSGAMRACTADISDWITRDLDALVNHASGATPSAPLFLIGHSLGGQTAPLLPSIGRVSGLVNIAVGSGATRHNEPGTRRRAPLLWYLLAPLLCPLFGYFPGARIGIIGDVPRRAMFQWRRWCLSSDYLLSAEPGARAAYARASYPVLGLTFSDDELLLESGSGMMHAAYTGTTVDYRVIHAQQHGLPRIGHFGFFKPNQETILWPHVRAWLDLRSIAQGPNIATSNLAQASPAT